MVRRYLERLSRKGFDHYQFRIEASQGPACIRIAAMSSGAFSDCFCWKLTDPPGFYALAGISAEDVSPHSEALDAPTTERMVKAIQQGDLAEVTKVLDEGLDVNASLPGYFRKTALHLAAALNQLAIARLLLERGADVNSRFGEGSPPIQEPVVEAMQGKIQDPLPMVDLLTESGAKISPAIKATEWASDRMGIQSFLVADRIRAELLQRVSQRKSKRSGR